MESICKIAQAVEQNPQASCLPLVSLQEIVQQRRILIQSITMHKKESTRIKHHWELKSDWRRLRFHRPVPRLAFLFVSDAIPSLCFGLALQFSREFETWGCIVLSQSEFAGNPESCTLMYTAYSKEGSTAGSAEGCSSQLPTRPAAQDKESRANIRLQHEFYQVGCFFFG